MIDEVKAEEEKKISPRKTAFHPAGHEEDEKKEDNDSDKEEVHVFYKSDDLIHQPKSAMRNWLRKTGK